MNPCNMDLVEKQSRIICEICQKEFSSTSTKNRHLRIFHNAEIIHNKTQRIRCPLCLEEEKFRWHEHFIEHLKQFHTVNIKECVVYFRNFDEFELWRVLENVDVGYACHRRGKLSNGDEDIYYNCNRSDTRGFKSKAHKRTMKSGGSIRIQGTCPSRIVAKVLKSGEVTVKFVETHVGHAEMSRSKVPSKIKEDTAANQLTTEVEVEKIVTSSLITDNDRICSPLLSEKGGEPTTNQNSKTLINFEQKREAALEEICKFARSLDEDLCRQFITDINRIKSYYQEKMGLCKK